MQLISTDKFTVIVGLGITGLSCVRYLQSAQRPFMLVDTRSEPPGAEAFINEFPDVPYVFGEQAKDVIDQANELIINPGISLYHPLLIDALKNGAKASGDIDLFARAAKAPIIAITGTNGKTTVTTLVGELVKACGYKVLVGGNIGLPALDLLTEAVPDYYVLELSSFQLERCENLNAEVAVVLNMSADHLDHHGSFPRYHLAKHRIFMGAKKAVINNDDPLSKALVSEDVMQVGFSLGQPDFNGFGVIEHEGERYIAYRFEPIMPVADIKMVGDHNLANVMAALAIGYALDFPMSDMITAIAEFTGLPHRSQWVRTLDDVDYYNDSKGTNIGATKAALKGLRHRYANIVLIAGGVAKGASFNSLQKVVDEACSAIILMGESAQQIATDLANEEKIFFADSLEQAVSLAQAKANAGDAVLLSPACASFDMFKNYEARGDAFSSAVKDLIGGNNG